MKAGRSRISVVICSAGRPECLRDIVGPLARQSRPADRVVFVVPDPADCDVDASSAFGPHTKGQVIVSARGSACQRNAGLDAVAAHTDIVVFYDDDFVPSRRALEGIEAAFARWPEVAGMTGHVIADGINGPGIAHADALAMVEDYDAAPAAPPRIVRSGLVGLYGCNMACRMSAVGGTRFDERLPLYAWLEDIDFAARLGGDLVRTDAFAGVHMGIKAGRPPSGVRLGYSQVANPWYLWRKGSVPARFALRLAARNVAANLLRARRPEPWIDRVGRARGNRMALMDILRGRADPERILSL